MSNNTWSTGPVFTPQRADFALASNGTKLFAIGGDTTGGGFFDVSAQVDELETSTWPSGSWVNSLPNLPSARQADSAGFFTRGRVGGEIWSTSGINGSFVFLTDHLFRLSPLQLISAVSRKSHGGTPYDIPLPLNGAPGVECRAGSGHTLVFTFTTNVASGSASVTAGTGVAGAATFSGNTMTVPLTWRHGSATNYRYFKQRDRRCFPSATCDLGEHECSFRRHERKQIRECHRRFANQIAIGRSDQRDELPHRRQCQRHDQRDRYLPSQTEHRSRRALVGATSRLLAKAFGVAPYRLAFVA